VVIICLIAGVDVTRDPAEVASSLGVDTAVAAAVAPRGDANQEMLVGLTW